MITKHILKWQVAILVGEGLKCTEEKVCGYQCDTTEKCGYQWDLEGLDAWASSPFAVQRRPIKSYVMIIVSYTYCEFLLHWEWGRKEFFEQVKRKPTSSLLQVHSFLCSELRSNPQWSLNHPAHFKLKIKQKLKVPVTTLEVKRRYEVQFPKEK